jgi:hypothetical protein
MLVNLAAAVIVTAAAVDPAHNLPCSSRSDYSYYCADLCCSTSAKLLLLLLLLFLHKSCHAEAPK